MEAASIAAAFVEELEDSFNMNNDEIASRKTETIEEGREDLDVGETIEEGNAGEKEKKAEDEVGGSEADSLIIEEVLDYRTYC